MMHRCLSLVRSTLLLLLVLMLHAPSRICEEELPTSFSNHRSALSFDEDGPVSVSSSSNTVKNSKSNSGVGIDHIDNKDADRKRDRADRNFARQKIRQQRQRQKEKPDKNNNLPGAERDPAVVAEDRSAARGRAEGRRKYSSVQCVGGSQFVDPRAVAEEIEHAHQGFPLYDDDTRVCLFRNVCLVDGNITFYLRGEQQWGVQRQDTHIRRGTKQSTEWGIKQGGQRDRQFRSHNDWGESIEMEERDRVRSVADTGAFRGSAYPRKEHELYERGGGYRIMDTDSRVPDGSSTVRGDRYISSSISSRGSIGSLSRRTTDNGPVDKLKDKDMDKDRGRARLGERYAELVDFFPEGFGGRMFHTSHLREHSVKVHSIPGPMPRTHTLSSPPSTSDEVDRTAADTNQPAERTRRAPAAARAPSEDPDSAYEYFLSPVDVTFLDANSWDYNYGHYVLDNVLPLFTAARIFNLPFAGVQQLWESRCRRFGHKQPKGWEDELVDYNNSMGTFSDACMRNVRMLTPYFFDHEPLFITDFPIKLGNHPGNSGSSGSGAKNICFRKLIAGQSKAFGLSSLDLSRGIVMREFRDFVLSRIFSSQTASSPPLFSAERERGGGREGKEGGVGGSDLHEQETHKVAPLLRGRRPPRPEQDRIILVAERTFGSAGGALVDNLCEFVRNATARNHGLYDRMYKVVCIEPTSLSFVQEVEYAQRARIIVSVHGTISYVSLFARDGTKQIVLAHPYIMKEHHMLFWATHFQPFYLDWTRMYKFDGLLKHTVQLSQVYFHEHHGEPFNYTLFD